MSSQQPSQFLLLYREASDRPEVSPAEMQRIFNEWMAWLNTQRNENRLIASNRLNDAGKVLRGSTSVTDRPFAEAKEVVGGFVVITAENLDHATQIARSCPGLSYGGSMEVRPIEPKVART
ncbi:MAG TPA: YciI family protein [Opitutaceae bacterium]